jgi:hypothetical protein
MAKRRYFFLIETSVAAYGKCANIHTSFTTSETIICGPGSQTISFINTSTGDEATTGGYDWYLNGVAFNRTSGLTPPVTSVISETGTYAYMLVEQVKTDARTQQ